MRSLRLALAAVAVAGVVAPLSAHASTIPPFPYYCRVDKTPVAQWSPDIPVVGGSYVYTYDVRCYG
jgi:hypothetical protein